MIYSAKVIFSPCISVTLGAVQSLMILSPLVVIMEGAVADDDDDDDEEEEEEAISRFG